MRIKKHSRTSPGVQFEEFSLITQKIRPRTDYEVIWQTISKKIRSKKWKKSENQACEKKTNTDKLKFGSNKKLGLEWTMNGLEKPYRKKPNPKNWKKKQ